MDKVKLVVCNKCRWIHFKVSKEYVYSWLKDWVDFWIKLDKEGRKNYGCEDAPPSPQQYVRCIRCGNSYKNFTDAKKVDYDRSVGHTINPILNQKDEL